MGSDSYKWRQCLGSNAEFTVDLPLVPVFDSKLSTEQVSGVEVSLFQIGSHHGAAQFLATAGYFPLHTPPVPDADKPETYDGAVDGCLRAAKARLVDKMEIKRTFPTGEVLQGRTFKGETDSDSIEGQILLRGQSTSSAPELISLLVTWPKGKSRPPVERFFSSLHFKEEPDFHLEKQ